jgi:hypothetical protein
MVVAAQLLRAGGRVAALASLRPLREMLGHPRGLWQGRGILYEGLRYARSVLRAGVELLPTHVPIRALGGEHLEAVVLARVDRDGHAVAGTEREIACDLLAVNYGFAANSELAAMAGAAMRFEAAGGGWLPIADEFGRTSVRGLFVAGDGAGVRGALVAEAEGHIVGAAAASAPGEVGGGALRAAVGEALARRRRQQEFQRAVRATLVLPPGLWGLARDDTIVCRCENVALGEIRAAFSGGHASLNAVKRNVRAGMGWCGGRTCLRAVAALAELHAGVPADAMMTPRPMVRPVSFGALAAQQEARRA